MARTRCPLATVPTPRHMRETTVSQLQLWWRQGFRSENPDLPKECNPRQTNAQQILSVFAPIRPYGIKSFLRFILVMNRLSWMPSVSSDKMPPVTNAREPHVMVHGAQTGSKTPEVDYLRKSLALVARTHCPLATVPTPRHMRETTVSQLQLWWLQGFRSEDPHLPKECNPRQSNAQRILSVFAPIRPYQSNPS